MIKENDIIEVTMSIEMEDIPEDATCIDVADYNQNFEITYYTPNDGTAVIDFEIGKGFSSLFSDDIEEFIKDDLKKSFEEIEEYEIFDVDKSDSDYQTAKIKVIKIKE